MITEFFKITNETINKITMTFEVLLQYKNR